MTNILENNFNLEQYQKYMLQKNVDDFLNAFIAPVLHPIADKIIKYVNLPEPGDHLVTPRLCHTYTHHGIYVGNREVIQYSGFASDDFNYNDNVPIYSEKRSSVEKVSIEDFVQGGEYKVEEHAYATFKADKIVQRAFEKLNENKAEYNLLLNNCEHFANWCIYGIKKSKQVDNARRIASRVAKPLSVIEDTRQAVKSFESYMRGEINGKKLLQDIGHISTTSAGSLFYSIVGTAVIPIPVVGFFIGSVVGYVIGNLLYSSGLFSLTGDAAIVKQAKNRRKKIEKISSFMLPMMQENRKKLEQYIAQHFSDRKKIFDQAFLEYNRGINEKNPELVTSGLSKINDRFGKKLTHDSIGDFKIWLSSERL